MHVLNVKDQNLLTEILNSFGAHTYIKVKGGKSANGFLYEVVSYEEYRKLRKGIDNILDEVMKNLRQATAPVVSQTELKVKRY